MMTTTTGDLAYICAVDGVPFLPEDPAAARRRMDDAITWGWLRDDRLLCPDHRLQEGGLR